MTEAESRTKVIAGEICVQAGSSNQSGYFVLEISGRKIFCHVSGIFHLCIFCFKYFLLEYSQIGYHWKALDTTNAS